MNISLNELVILSQFGYAQPRFKDAGNLAYRAAQQVPQPSFDAVVASENIKSLIQRRLLREDRDKSIALTQEGWLEVLNALPVLERLRGQIAGVRPS